MENNRLPKAITASKDLIERVAFHLFKNSSDALFQVRFFPAWLAADRLAQNPGIFGAAGDLSSVHDHTFDHNLSQLGVGAAQHRPLLLLQPLTSIGEVVDNVSKLKVLCVGPRSEAEIFYLRTFGFDLHNVRGVDLISYSEYVDIGDMHDLSYEDSSFDVVIMGWVLAYSKDNRQAMKECMRVLRPGGFAAIGNVCEPVVPPRYDVDLDDIKNNVVGGYTTTSTVDGVYKEVSRYFYFDQLRRLCAPYIDWVYFQQAPSRDRLDVQDNVMVVFKKR